MPYKDPEKARITKKKWYEDNKASYAHAQSWRRRLFRKIVAEIKGSTPCADCNHQYPAYVMQFDHLPDFNKKFTIGDIFNASSVKMLLDEIDKCEVVCANCHAERTHKRLIADGLDEGSTPS